MYFDKKLICECDSSSSEKKYVYSKERGHPIYSQRIKNLCYTEVTSIYKIKGSYYFLAKGAGSNEHLWKSDGTVEGTICIIPKKK